MEAKACAYEREERYQTAETFLKDLKAIQTGTMVSVGESDRRYRWRKFVRKYRTALAATAAAILFLATVALLYLRSKR